MPWNPVVKQRKYLETPDCEITNPVGLQGLPGFEHIRAVVERLLGISKSTVHMEVTN